MAKLPNLQQIRDTVRGAIMAANLAKQSNGNTQQLHNALAVVPESKMYNLMIWLHEVLLPKIAQSRGVDSDEYKNHEAIRDAVIWSLHISGAYEKLLFKNTKDLQLLGYYIEKCAFLERELQKYTTVEQLITNETADVYRQSVISKAVDILNKKG